MNILTCTENKPQCGTALRLLAMVLMLLGSYGAQAVTCTGGNITRQINFPSKIAVARDLPPYTVLTNWVVVPGSLTEFSCTGLGTAGEHHWGPAATATTYAQSWGTVLYNGADVTVYKTNVRGIGLAIASQAGTDNVGGWVNGWATVNSTWYGNYWVNAGGSHTMGLNIAAALVKTSEQVETGLIPAGLVARTAPYIDTAAYSSIASSYTMNAVAITQMACTTPDVDVPMGAHHESEMPSNGTTSRNPASFTLKFNNCPAYITRLSGARSETGQINSVSYKIEPVDGLVAGYSNVAKIAGGTGAAEGVGIQLLTSSDAVVPLNTKIALSEYNSVGGGSYSVPMKAVYYRTGVITPGTANTSMLLTAFYE